jgi:beta-lactamase regulating signal transducer with metallopeptidase domain
LTWNVWLDALLPWLSLAWMVGAVLFCIRPVAGYWGQLRLAKQRSLNIPEQLAARLERAACRVGIQRTVELRLVHGRVGPMVAGWFRPIIILPISIASTMSPQEIELLLAHELAHVRRHDCWINTLQVFIETIFFYHPAVWWLSGEVRMTREHCCDDMAAPDPPSRLVFARALLALEQHRSPQLSLAISAGDGDLLRRIRRLSAGGSDRNSSLMARLAVCAVVAAATVILACILTPQARPSRIAAAVDQQESADTIGISTDAAVTAALSIDG